MSGVGEKDYIYIYIYRERERFIFKFLVCKMPAATRGLQRYKAKGFGQTYLQSGL